MVYKIRPNIPCTVHGITAIIAFPAWFSFGITELVGAIPDNQSVVELTGCRDGAQRELNAANANLEKSKQDVVQAKAKHEKAKADLKVAEGELENAKKHLEEIRKKLKEVGSVQTELKSTLTHVTKAATSAKVKKIKIILCCTYIFYEMILTKIFSSSFLVQT